MLIGELVKKTGVSKDTIRHYERINLLKNITFNIEENGYRNYNNKAVETINFVLLAKEYGCTLNEINDLIETHLESGLNRASLEPFVKQKLKSTKAEIQELSSKKKNLEKLLRFYKGCC